MTSIVLAGGKGLRLGQIKAQEKIGERTLLERVIESLESFSGEIIVVIAQDQEEPIIPAMGLKIVVDLYPDKSALGGIYTGLLASNSLYNIVVACDMPFLNTKFLQYMLTLAPGYEAVMPKVGKYLEAIHAVYSRDCIEPIRRQIEEGNLKVSDLPSRLNVRFVEDDDIDKYDPEHLSFFNINTQADLKKAKSILNIRT
jgi:molybdopterin-guanine dinucleotide biosynthesis protein A